MNIRLKFHSKEVLYMLYLTLEVLFILYVISNHIILLDLNVYIFNTHKKEMSEKYKSYIMFILLYSTQQGKTWTVFINQESLHFNLWKLWQSFWYNNCKRVCLLVAFLTLFFGKKWVRAVIHTSSIGVVLVEHPRIVWRAFINFGYVGIFANV